MSGTVDTMTPYVGTHECVKRCLTQVASGDDEWPLEGDARDENEQIQTEFQSVFAKFVGLKDEAPLSENGKITLKFNQVSFGVSGGAGVRG
jgi:hypothetical protein